jgi:hypothetical protein
VAKAAATKSAELATYDKADVVITVTDADAAILHRENPASRRSAFRPSTRSTSPSPSPSSTASG